jgi:NitT/TauT family transport system permease protein/taurine transport system permease protein
MSDHVRRLGEKASDLTGVDAAALEGGADARLGERLRSHGKRLGARSQWGLMTALGLGLFVVVWELLALIVHDPVVLPTPFETAATWLYYMSHRYPTVGYLLWQHALFSTLRILIGFVGGVVIGVTIGALMTAIRPVRNLLDPLIELTRPLPPLAFIPIFIVWFGVGNLPKVILILIGVIPVMIVSTVSALDQVPQDLVNAARCLGASRSYALIHVRVRAAIPSIITGMRLSMGGAWTSIVAAEMIVATSGLGYVILQASLYLDSKLIFAGIALIGVLGIGFDTVLRWLQRLADPSRRTG